MGTWVRCYVPVKSTEKVISSICDSYPDYKRICIILYNTKQNDIAKHKDQVKQTMKGRSVLLMSQCCLECLCENCLHLHDSCNFYIKMQSLE